MSASVSFNPPDARADPWAPVLDRCRTAALGALRSLRIAATPGEFDAVVDTEGRPDSDVSVPVHRWARPAGRAPKDLAEELASHVTVDDVVRRAHGDNGYLNLTVDAAWMAERTLRLIFDRAAQYGHSVAVPHRLCVEHTSANPTQPLHVGRVRNAFVGDTLARSLRAAGADVTTQYYVDDLGRQSAMITWIWSKPPADWPDEIREAIPPPNDAAGEKPDARLGRPYPAVNAYLKAHAAAADEVADLVRRLEGGSPPPEHRRLAEEILSGMLESLGRVGVRFDEFVWESSFLRDGSVDRIMGRLDRAPHAVREPNGAGAIDATPYGLPTETARVIYRRSDGTSLYPTRDVAYHLAKFARFEEVVDVLGQDHVLHSRSLNALLAEIGEPRRPRYVIYQDLTIPGGGRMAARKGTAVSLDDLLAEATRRARAEVLARREDLNETEVHAIADRVAAGAIRYHILRVAPEKTVGFAWEDALSFEGRSGPFVQYSYARASSLLRKGDRTTPPYPFDAAQLATPDERALVKRLSRLPRLVAFAAWHAHPHRLTGYAHDVAEEFNRFYHSTPVLKAGAERGSRIALVAATRQVLGNTLDLIGLDRLERM